MEYTREEIRAILAEDVRRFERILQADLQRGWEEFNAGGEALDRYLYFSRWLHDQDFYGSEIRGREPNPANNRAAQAISKYVRSRLRGAGILYDDGPEFPGDYFGSEEAKGAGGSNVDIRIFTTPLESYHGNNYTLTLAFPHQDWPAQFPQPPTLNFRRVS